MSVIKTKNSKSVSDSIKNISPYDSIYPSAFLKNELSTLKNKAQLCLSEVYQSVTKNSSVTTQVIKATKKGVRYVVDTSPELLKKIEKGAVKFTKENGKTFAQLKIGNKYGKKIPIKKEVFSQNLDLTQLSNALQMQAIQNEIRNMENQLVMIDSSVREISQGLQNDRIGMYYSGLALFLESNNISDTEMKKLLLSQSLKTLAEASFQLKLSFEADLNYLVNEEYNKVKGKRKELIENKINNINQSFSFVHQASLVRAGIYCNMGELPSMVSVLNEYSTFIDKDISPNAPFLAAFDSNDDGSENGVWKSRSKLKLDVSEIVKSLNNPSNTYYLGVKTKENKNGKS